MEGPSRIAEMAAQLACDRGHGESAEGAAAARVEPRQRLEQAHVAHLEVVVEGVAAGAVARRQSAHQALVALDELLVGGLVVLVGPSQVEVLRRDPVELEERKNCGGRHCANLIWSSVATVVR